MNRAALPVALLAVVAVLFPVVGALFVVIGRRLSDVRPSQRSAASRPDDL